MYRLDIHYIVFDLPTIGIDLLGILCMYLELLRLQNVLWDRKYIFLVWNRFLYYNWCIVCYRWSLFLVDTWYKRFDR